MDGSKCSNNAYLCGSPLLCFHLHWLCSQVHRPMSWWGSSPAFLGLAVLRKVERLTYSYRVQEKIWMCINMCISQNTCMERKSGRRIEQMWQNVIWEAQWSRWSSLRVPRLQIFGETEVKILSFLGGSNSAPARLVVSLESWAPPGSAVATRVCRALLASCSPWRPVHLAVKGGGFSEG